MTFRLKPRECLLAVLGGIILAFGLYNVHSVADISEGGVLGLVLLFEHHFHLSPAITGLILNALCYFIGWRSLGSDFIGYSIFAGGTFSLFYAIFEKFPPLFPEIATYPILAAIVGAVFVGVGVGIAVWAGGAPSGDDALAMSMSKLLHIDIKWTYLISDITVLALSLTYIHPSKILFSLITVVLSGQIIDLIQKIKPRSSEEITDETRDVLCGTMRNTMQLDICLAKKFYHIPAVRLKPGDFPLRYIALYQSLHKFGDRAGIIYYGEIEKYALTKRRDIAEIPRDSNELYYRFDIKEWKRLPSPVLPDNGDFINLTTSLFLLTHSHTTSELNLASSRELLLYRKIERLVSGEISEIPSDGGKGVLRFSHDTLSFFFDGKETFSVPIDEYKKNPLSSFRYILREFEK